MGSTPDWNDPGHGPLSSKDERVGGFTGAVSGAALGKELAGNGGMIAGAIIGWAVGEEAIDYVGGVNEDGYYR
jgi:outer membrane lipoprotein SlyB